MKRTNPKSMFTTIKDPYFLQEDYNVLQCKPLQISRDNDQVIVEYVHKDDDTEYITLEEHKAIVNELIENYKANLESLREEFTKD